MMRLCLAAIPLLLLAAAAPADSFWLELDGHRVTVGNDAVEFNCGSEVIAEMDVLDWTVRLHEIEDLVNPAYCWCDFDVKFQFELAEPGLYHLEFWRVYWDEAPLLVWETDFQIDEDGQLVEVTVQQSECGGWMTALPGDEPLNLTFSAVRSLY